MLLTRQLNSLNVDPMNDKHRQMAILTVFAMLLVVLGHSDITDDYKQLWHFRWIYSFHMPLFFFISGFLFSLTNPIERLQTMSYTSFLKKKTVRLLSPFLFFNTVIFLIKATLVRDPSMMQHPTTLALDSFIHYTLFAPIGFMWFLPALFIVFVLIFPFWKIIRCKLRRGGEFLLLAVVFVLFVIIDVILVPLDFLQIGSAIHYMPYFILGMVYCLYEQTVDRYLMKWWKILILVSCILSVSLLMRDMVAAFCGITFCLCSTLVLADKGGNWVVKFSCYCYPIFLLSYFPQMFVRGPIAYNFPDVNQYLLSALSFVLGLSVPLGICVVYESLGKRYALVRHMGILIGL